MDEFEKNKGIKSWAADDRPREKLIIKGTSALSDAELIAILIGSGTKERSAVQVAQEILKTVNGNLDELGKKSLKELVKHKGIGDARAITIAAALELGRRRQVSKPDEKPKITSSKDAYNEMSPIRDLPVEEFWLLLLNRNNRLILKTRISIGGISGTYVDVKMIYKTAMDHLASSIIVAHNHPSGNLKPSQQDIVITDKLKEVGKIVDISFADHIIVSSDGYYSFADQGQI